MLGRHDRTPRLKHFARTMRHHSTDAEQKLWKLLREKFPAYCFRRQHPIGGYIADFICLTRNLVIELDGGQHTKPEALAYDNDRTKQLSNLNLQVLRISDRDMLKDSDAVLQLIHRTLEPEDPSPEPSPRVQGEGTRSAETVTPSDSSNH